MIFNTYEEEIDYILEYHGPSALILSEDESLILQDQSWIFSEYVDHLVILEESEYLSLLGQPKINWLKEGF